jgi:RNA polymerase sigma-70 factor (ECF subfamily)
MANPHEQAFLGAFEEYSDALFRHVYFRVSNRERAADLVQDTFLKAWDYVQKGKAIDHWKSFLYHIMNNLIIDEYRKKKEVSLDAMLDEETTYTPAMLAVDSRTEREERFDDETLRTKIRELIAELPEREREALTLRYIDGLSPKEIAPMLGISENAASVRVHRALGELKKRCGPLDTL